MHYITTRDETLANVRRACSGSPKNTIAIYLLELQVIMLSNWPDENGY